MKKNIGSLSLSGHKSKGSSKAVLRITLLQGLVLWSLMFFSAQIVWADPDGQSLAANNSSVMQSPVEISVQTFASPEEYFKANIPGRNRPSLTKFFTLTNPERSLEIKNIWSKVIGKGMYYVEYPTQELAKHFNEQVHFYQTEKYSLVVLTAMTTFSAVTWYFFADQGTMSQKSFLVAMNALLYGYLLVNVRNWQSYLKHSENVVEKIKQRQRSSEGITSNERLFANMSANFAFFLVYNLAVQGILSWSDLSQLLGVEMISFMLTNSVLGVATSGVWDFAFRNWFLESKISTTSLIRLNWLESLVMTTIHAFIAMGYPEGYMALAAHGTLGTASIILTTTKMASSIEKLKAKAHWTYQRGRMALKALTDVVSMRPKASDSSLSHQMCQGYLGY